MKISDLLENFEDSPPAVFSRLHYTLVQAREDPDVSLGDYAEIMEQHPDLAARVLKFINSPLYGFDLRVETPAHALSKVAPERFAYLVLAAELMLKFQEVPNDLASPEAFWRHSFACGLAAWTLAGYVKGPHVESHFAAGIMHDLGTLVLFKPLAERIPDLVFQCRTKKENLFEAEKEIFGFNHAELGGELLSRWNLPPHLTEAVRYHHDPLATKKFAAQAAIVHVSDIIAHEEKIGNSGEPFTPAYYPGILEQMNLSGEMIKAVRHYVKLKFHEIFEIVY